MPCRVTLKLEGFARDNGHVSLSAFLHQVQAFSSMLARAGEMNSSGQRSANARVVDLSHSSPATITIELLPVGPDTGQCEEIVKNIRLVPTLGNNPDLFGDRGRAFLQSFEEMATPVGKSIPGVSIMLEDQELILDQSLKRTIKRILSAEESEIASVEGKLEAINLHDNANVFFVYPIVGAKKVRCVFSVDLREPAIAAIDSHVTVYGTVRYKAGDPYPFAVDATDLTVNPSDEDLPTMASLYGIAPDLTGGLSSEEFVRLSRDGWR